MPRLIRQLEYVEEESTPIRIKIVKKSNKSNNVQNNVFNKKKKPWKRRHGSHDSHIER